MTSDYRVVSRRKRFAFVLSSAALAGILALGLGEIILRAFPIPGIEYHSFAYNEITGGTPYPNTTIIYRSARGDVERRRVNSWGFLDGEHEVIPSPGTYRIAFFGDSYVEGRQVALDRTFPHLIEAELNLSERRPARNQRNEKVERVEVMMMGVAGRSALQSYLEYTMWSDLIGADLVVYVFSENDVSDQLRNLQVYDIRPFASLAGNDLIIDGSFRDRYRIKASAGHRLWQRLKSHSLVLSTIEGRLRLLQRHGIRTRTRPEDVDGDKQTPNPGMSPSTWGDSLATYGWKVQEKIMERWRADVMAHNSRFWIMRVPRESKIDQPAAEQDSWAPRLYEYTSRDSIPLVDPTEQLRDAISKGKEVYYDHYTPEGHEAVAKSFLVFWDRFSLDNKRRTVDAGL